MGQEFIWHTPDRSPGVPVGPQATFHHNPQVTTQWEYIMAIDQACSKLNQGEAEELRVEVKNALKKAHLPKPNITKEEILAIKELKRDDNRMILTADKKGGFGGDRQIRVHQERRRTITTYLHEDC